LLHNNLPYNICTLIRSTGDPIAIKSNKDVNNLIAGIVEEVETMNFDYLNIKMSKKVLNALKLLMWVA